MTDSEFDAIHRELTKISHELPQLILPETAYGSTGYLDGLENSEMTNRAMGGTDKWGRPFIALQIISEVSSNKFLRNGHAEVLFKRYSPKEGDPRNDVWTSGGPHNLIISRVVLDDVVRVQKLLAGEEAVREAENEWQTTKKWKLAA